jgi:hypothetical protein
MYYLLKVKGKAKIPDYVQLRDSSFTLIAYFRLDRPDRALEKSGLEAYTHKIIQTATDMPFGEVRKIELI